MLGLWGPNRAIDQIVTRYKLNSNGLQLEREGRPVLEFVAIRRLDNTWALPGAFKQDDGVLPILRKAFGLHPDAVALHEELKEVERVLKEQCETLFTGYMDDTRNTDNAWVETECQHVHDDSGILGRHKFNSNIVSGVQEVAWIVAHEDLELFADHRSLLQYVVQTMEAFW